MPRTGNRNAFTTGKSLLCGSADPQPCPRSVTTEFLAERLGAEVKYILAPERSIRPNDQLRLPGWE